MKLPIIKNIEKLATTQLRRDALEILEAGYESVLTEKLVRSQVIIDSDYICVKDEKICLGDFERIFFVAIGKCAVDAAMVFEEMLGDKITDGIVLDVKTGIFKKLRSEIGTHPLPSEKNVEVTKSIARMIENSTEKDLIITIISGGGSSLLCLPYESTCLSLQNTTDILMKKGATIEEINTVRKHLSGIQGGQFAKLAYPATILSFIFSDVPGNDLSVIASGPTVMDKTTNEDAKNILEKFGLGKNILLNETPKDEKYFKNVFNILLATNEIALEAMKRKAEQLDYDAYIEKFDLQGEARNIGKKFAVEDYVPRSCYLFGGETTVTVKGDGEGGRNQELVLSALSYLREGVIIVAAASDGWDNSDVAGAVGDSNLYKEAMKKGIDPEEALENNDSYNFFKNVGGQIKTGGRTGINVSDFYMVLKK